MVFLKSFLQKICLENFRKFLFLVRVIYQTYFPLMKRPKFWKKFRLKLDQVHFQISYSLPIGHSSWPLIGRLQNFENLKSWKEN